MSKLNEALRDLKRDEYEIALRKDEAKLSEFRQVRAELKRPRLIDENRSEVTGY